MVKRISRLDIDIKEILRLFGGEERVMATLDTDEVELYIEKLRGSGLSIGEERIDEFGYRILPAQDGRKRLAIFKRGRGY